MRCPYCDNQNTRVVDTREASEKVRRRRECSGCDRRFTTYETVEKVDITVIKRDGENEEFREEKIYDGVERAASKTSITETQIEEIVDEVKKSVRDKEQVKASEIGRAVLEALKNVMKSLTCDLPQFMIRSTMSKASKKKPKPSRRKIKIQY